MKIIYINPLSKALDGKYWRYRDYTITHMSGHQYYNSPYESDDECGNCNGACCEFCHEIVEEPELEFSPYSDDLVDLLVASGMPRNVAEDYAYNDFYSAKKHGYDVDWPHCTDLERKYPEEFKKIMETCKR